MIADPQAAVSDTELVRAAQAGDVASLGVLFGRHRAAMYAVALAVLGAGPDAEDAVQDAALIAVGRLGDLRDPEAVGAWLRGIVRNACRALHRRGRFVAGELPERAAQQPGPEQLLDQLAQRDWVWRALDQLSPPLRMVTMLRYFTGYDDYASIALACGVPVGTVRSRLSEARAKMTGALWATAETAGADDLAAVSGFRRRQAAELLARIDLGDFATMTEVFHPDVVSLWPSGRRGRGLEDLVRPIERDLAAGVRHPLRGVTAGRDVLIWENDLISPPEDPEHCPPAVAWVQTLRQGRVSSVRMVHRLRATSQ
jgi:RNA polymerase sigma-70 factor (ECF subfamily)